jgi:hypothetical protein
MLLVSPKCIDTNSYCTIKSVESTDHETGLPDSGSREVSIENTDDGSKAESVNSKMSGGHIFCMSESIVRFKRSDNRSRKLNCECFGRSVEPCCAFFVIFLYKKW